jgi:hypothetical protein
MQLFPERDDRSGRQLLSIALILSFLVHLVGVGAWVLFGERVAPVIAKMMPTPTPEIVALSDAITIEQRTVPREAHPAAQRQRRPQPRPRRVAQLPSPQRPELPTLPPAVVPTNRPSLEPTAEPTYRPEPGQIHHPRAEPTREPTPEPTPRETPTPKPPSKSALSAQQLAALDAQFSRTIAQAQHALSNVPPPRRPSARRPDQLRYQEVMSGTPEQFFAAFQGDCYPLQGPMMHGAVRYYYLRCMIRYNDGYFENVTYPWVYKFPARMDPFDERVNPNYDMRFGPQGPPDGFALPPHFALSRAICTFYRAQCENIFARERANGNQPATDQQ